ncbi:MAG: DNA translocase FtsK 4TM domain-containing protein [Polyangiaceae bacterium]|nr:DNA translocase FtsK 4TM domain-containing protein [Polyangiaceae bacterium]
MNFPLFAPRRAQPAAGPGGAPAPRAASRAADPPAERGERPTHSYAREAAALVLLTSALYTALALASFRADPLRPEIAGEDWVGPVGATLAQAVVGAVGVVSWFLPIELTLLSAPLLGGKRSIAGVTRVAGDVVVIVVLAALGHVAFPKAVAFGAMPIGGAVGELFGEVLRALFSSVGSYIIGLTVVALILIGRATFSFIELVHRTEQIATAIALRLAGWARALFGAWAAARELDRQEADGPRIARSSSPDAIIAALADDDGPLTSARDSAPSAPPAALPAAPLAIAADDWSRAPAELLGPRSAPGSAIEPASAAAPAPAPRRRGKRAQPAAEPAAITSAAIEPAAIASAAIETAAVASAATATAAVDLTPLDLAPLDLAAGSPAPPPAVDDLASALDEPSALDVPTPSPILPVRAAPAARAAPAPAPAERAQPSRGPTIVDTSHALEAEKPVEVRVVPALGEGFRLPTTDMLEEPAGGRIHVDEAQLKAMAQMLEKTLADYGVSGKVEEIHPGPTVTTFEVSPAAGTKVSKVAGLADDLALGLSRKVRIIAPIPGKNRIGFEIPNEHRLPVNLRELVEDRRFLEMKAPLPCVLGRDIIGTPYFADLASMPHVIVAGATGAGKSVGLNVMLVSLLFRKTPADLRLLMIDPKVVELAPFDRIPHMLLPVVTDMKQAANALKWAVDEMERRYQLFANAGTKNITTYNAWIERVHRGEARPPKAPAKVSAVAPDGSEVEVPAARDGSDAALPEKIPFIVIVVDEFADLMMQQGKDVEASVARLAQKARAAGMHVILATQRPSVDVITGMIKANFPTRIAFRVAQKVDSRTILDEQGAEHLLGRGDMLVKMNGSNDTRRVQCPFCSEEEVQRITDFLRLQGEPVYDEAILKPRDEEGEEDDTADAESDPMYDAAVRIVAETRRCSTSWLQRKLGVGYNRAAKLVEAMEKRGLVGPANGAKDREVLIAPI